MIQNILVLVDFSDCSIYAAKVAVDLGRKVNSKIHLLYVKDDTNNDISQRKIEKQFINLKKRTFLKDINVITVVKHNDICNQVKIYEKDHDIDLIVTGSMKELNNVNSLSRQLKSNVLSPVLAVRSEFYRKKNDVLHEQNVLIEQSHQEISAKQKEITESLSYAKRIQNAILPSPHVTKKYLDNSFILYKPKDIVAGDFYWLEHVGETVLFAAADCTGHGVPGAMISVVCNNALNHAVREHALTEPGLILDTARRIIVQEFEKSSDGETHDDPIENPSNEIAIKEPILKDAAIKDGMDIALCSLKGNELKYAGALNPLWIIRQGKVIETKGDKQPIGKFDNPFPYTTHTFDLQKGDTFYIFSDGYADQFGGEKNKKFKTRAFRELLLSIQDKSMSDQKAIINESFETWKGDQEQVDDVCIIGVRI
jgi:serine phosphatase RsbU (regulator of sigma subunit)/nucleotide-binding universal stress UspA family protein